MSKCYTSHKALDDVSLMVPTGSVYGLLGPNGAGKTTLIRIINHITAPDSGRVIFDGHQLTANDVAQIGYLPEERGLYKKMRVGEQAMFFAQLKGLDRREAERKLREWFEKFEILDWWNKKVEELSKGMAQKVQFIVTVLHQPKLLIFDEPFSGFDPVNAQLLKNEILALRDKGATVVFSTHNMESVEELCDNITLINASRNILSGAVAEVKSMFALGRYEIVIDNEAPATFLETIGPLVDETNARVLPDNRLSVSVKLAQGVTARDFVSKVNDCVNLYLFREVIPSMNDIFIQTVGSDAINS